MGSCGASDLCGLGTVQLRTLPEEDKGDYRLEREEKAFEEWNGERGAFLKTVCTGTGTSRLLRWQTSTGSSGGTL
jgi:hypothetical protein